MKHPSALHTTLLLAVISLSNACAGQGKTMAEDSTSQFAELKTTHSETSVKCPSRDFATFLRMYMDADSDAVRVNFTAEPVQYLVPFYLIEEPTDTSPDMHTSQLSGHDRFRHLPVRYFKAADGFYSVDESGSPESATVLHSKEGRYPLKIEIGKNGDREAIFGLEYEIDIYRFTHRNDCWYLTQIINPRD